MVTEDYVSLEAAKLLKEKGFDERVKSYFTDDGLEGYMSGTGQKSNSELEDCFYSRPTLQMAVKWLWQKHKLHVDPTMTIEKLGFTFLNKWHCFVVSVDNKDQTDLKCIGEDFGSYEEACEFGTKHCLEKLI